MTQAQPIKATFSDFKLIRGRKVAQLCFEVPLEGADAALSSLGGLPRPDSEKWFGIVALDLSNAASEPARPDKWQKTERKSWDELPLPQQAGIRCQEPEFRKFMKAIDYEVAVSKVRIRCGVESRSELATNKDAAAKWRELDENFFKWQRGMR